MNAEPKWTPGPWFVTEDRNTWGWVEVDGPSINVSGPTKATDLTPDDKVIRIAEAHLIAAAPDLYAALKSLVDAMDSPKTLRIDLLLARLGFARIALAKARGETQ